MEGLTKIFSLGMSEIFDLSPDRPGSASGHTTVGPGHTLRTVQRPTSPTTVRSRPGSSSFGGAAGGHHAPGSAPHGRKTRSRTAHGAAHGDADWGWGGENEIDVSKASCSPNSKAAVPGAQQGHRHRSGTAAAGVLHAVRDPAPEVHSSTFPVSTATGTGTAGPATEGSAKRQLQGSRPKERDTSGGAADQQDDLHQSSVQGRAAGSDLASGHRPAGLVRSSSLRLLSGGGGEGKGLFALADVVGAVSSVCGHRHCPPL